MAERFRSILGGIKLSVAIALVVVGIVFAGGFSATLEATNTDAFCTSCHSMQWVTAEWKTSEHYLNISGVQAGCADCHVPRSLGPKLVAKVIATKDLFHEIIGTINTEEKFEARRWHMANVVWRKMERTDSRECRVCHIMEQMNLEEQDSTARKKHKRAERDGITCIECHKGVAHIEPYEPFDEDEELEEHEVRLEVSGNSSG